MSSLPPSGPLARAAENVLARIRLLRSSVAPKIAVMLSYIEAHLFDPELSVSRMKRDCQIRDNSIAILFHSALGVAPGAFISQCRIEVAEKLLQDRELPVWQISEMIGYSSIQVFSRAFFRRTGIRPSTYRKRYGQAMPAGSTGYPDHVVLRGLRGELDDLEAGALIRQLLEIYPPRSKREGLEAGSPS